MTLISKSFCQSRALSRSPRPIYPREKWQALSQSNKARSPPALSTKPPYSHPLMHRRSSSIAKSPCYSRSHRSHGIANGKSLTSRLNCRRPSRSTRPRSHPMRLLSSSDYRRNRNPPKSLRRQCSPRVLNLLERAKSWLAKNRWRVLKLTSERASSSSRNRTLPSTKTGEACRLTRSSRAAGSRNRPSKSQLTSNASI